MCGPGLKCIKETADTAASCQPMDTQCVRAQQVNKLSCLTVTLSHCLTVYCLKSNCNCQKYDGDLESGQLGMDMLRPECDAEGAWAPVQCTGSDVCRWAAPDIE